MGGEEGELSELRGEILSHHPSHTPYPPPSTLQNTHSPNQLKDCVTILSPQPFFVYLNQKKIHFFSLQALLVLFFCTLFKKK